MGITSKKLEAGTYQDAAKLHCALITEGFLTTLGVPFLTLLYRSIDQDNGSAFLVEKVNGEVVGFVTGASGLGRIYKRLLLQPHRLLFALRGCLFSPLKIYRIFEILMFSIRKKGTAKLPSEELLTIVVRKDFQGNGSAERLFWSLCNHFASKGIDSFKIVVGGNLDRAHAFYKKMGCIPCVELQVHRGGNSMVYIKDLKALD